METIEYRDVHDKSDWGPGEWQDEPDKKQWQDEATGLPCLIVRNISGALCGYVGLPPSHRYYGSDYDHVDAEVHGGLTFAGKCQERENGVCHVPGDGEPDDVWWLGFDCNHAWDFAPASAARGMTLDAALFARRPDDIYRDFDYVTREVTSLAAQLSGLTATEPVLEKPDGH